MTDEQLREQFDRTFHGQPDLFVRSPGRVNLIGEHTDYNDGWALPIALDVGTDVAARRRDDRILRVVAPRLAATDEVPVDDLQSRRHPFHPARRYGRGNALPLDARHEVAAHCGSPNTSAGSRLRHPALGRPRRSIRRWTGQVRPLPRLPLRSPARWPPAPRTCRRTSTI
jgi:hypothetical protein